MMNAKTLLLSLALSLVAAGCTTPKRDVYKPGEPYRAPGTLTNMSKGQTIAQGVIGANLLTSANRSGGNNPPAGAQPDDLQQLPMIGGAFQHAMWGDRIDAGLEVGGSLGFSTGGGFVAAGGGGLVVAVDIDMFIFDLFGGPFVSMPLGDKARIYGSAGPLLQFANWDQTGEGVSQTGSGFGTGLYGRTGLEFLLSPSMLIGVGVRWFDSRVSLGSGLGDLDLQGTQAFVSFTSGI